VELCLDLTEAGERDDLARGVDYSRVLAAVREIGAGPPVKLLETLAARIAGAILERFPVRQVTVRATKPAPPLPDLTGGVAVEITRP